MRTVFVRSNSATAAEGAAHDVAYVSDRPEDAPTYCEPESRTEPALYRVTIKAVRRG